MGIPEGRVISMGGSHMGRVVKIIYRITVPIILTVPIKIFSTLKNISYFGSNQN